MISSKSVESQKLVADVKAAYETAVALNIPAGAPQARHAVRRKLESELSRITGSKIDTAEMDHWVVLKLNPAAPHGLGIELHHEHMFEARNEAPDWAYALYWCVNPKYSPRFKLWSDDDLPAENDSMPGLCPECGRATRLDVMAVDRESGTVIYTCTNNHVFQQR